MSCDLTYGRLEPCKNALGGIKAVLFGNFDPEGGFLPTFNGTNTDVIDSFDGAIVYKYDLIGENSFEQTIKSDRNNGTTVFEQTLKLKLKKLTPKDHKEIKLLCYGRPHVIVQDNNNNYFVCGLSRGMEVTGGTIATGTMLSDFSGYTLELKGEEKMPANFITSISSLDVVEGV